MTPSVYSQRQMTLCSFGLKSISCWCWFNLLRSKLNWVNKKQSDERLGKSGMVNCEKASAVVMDEAAFSSHLNDDGDVGLVCCWLTTLAERKKVESVNLEGEISISCKPLQQSMFVARSWHLSHAIQTTEMHWLVMLIWWCFVLTRVVFTLNTWPCVKSST